MMSKCLTNHALQCVEHFEHKRIAYPCNSLCREIHKRFLLHPKILKRNEKDFLMIKLIEYEKINYLMKDKKDFLISKIKKLEKYRLKNKDKETTKLIRTQLKDDWRNPLIYLNKLLIKY